MSNGNYVHRKSQKKRSKDSAMKIHCKSRFKQRFGLELTNNMYENMVAQIVKSKSRFVCAESNTRTVHIVNVLGKENLKVAAVYNKQKQLIHTIFPVDWITSGKFDEIQKMRKYINCVD